jgi:DNA processing protein
MGAALEGGGAVTAVLPHGVLSRQKDLAAMREFIDGGSLVVISQFQPNAPWQVGLAMARNSVVIGLSKLVIVADAGETGGTREAARTAFKRGVPVWVREHDPEESPGLAALVRSGARVLEIDREAPGETLDRLAAEAAEAGPEPPAEEPKQGKLF